MKRNLFAIFLTLALVVALVFVVAPTAKAENVTLTDGATLNITEDTVLDLAGNSGTVNVTEGVKLSVYDSANTGVTGEGAGKLTVNGKVEIEATDAAGRRFLAVPNDDGSYSFHPFFVGIEKVGVNTDKSALCLKVNFVANEIAQAKIETGVFYGTTPESLPNAADTYGAFSFENGVMVAYFDLVGSLDSQEAIDASRSFQAYIKIGNDAVTNRVYTVTPSSVISKLDEMVSDFDDAQKEKMVNMITGKAHLEALCPNFLHVHDYDKNVTDPTCNKAGVITYTCDCGSSYTEAGEPATGNHTDANSDYKCDVCSTKVLPADGEALTIPQALAIAKLHAHNAYTTQKYYITGTVTGLYNTQYGNFYIEDADGNQICIYGLYSADGKTRYDAMSYKPVNGDEVTVYTVLGMYNSTAQGKNAWLDEVVAHEHDYKSVVTEPSCTGGGYTTHTCNICGYIFTDTETERLDHVIVDGKCQNCTYSEDGPSTKEIVFNLGANGSASHADGSGSIATYSETVNNYKLSITGGTNMYTGARDAKGNSCIKLGTSKKAGSFNFTVADDVSEVKIYVAKYKTNNATVTVNGTKTTLTKASNNGEYDVITIDTTTTKTISFSVSSGYRCMVNTITFTVPNN